MRDDCQCTGPRLFIQSSRHAGESITERSAVSVCKDCGAIHVRVVKNGVDWATTIHLWTPELVRVAALPAAAVIEEEARETMANFRRPDEACILEEDIERLRGGARPGHLRYIYEPLRDLVTDEDLFPYCWGYKCVDFYPPRQFGDHWKVAQTSHEWYFDEIVESAGARWRLISARCVYRQGQWCMRWLARRQPER